MKRGGFLRIQADINTKGQVAISSFLAVPELGKSGQVVFVIDTGSSVTILSEGDAIKLDIDPGKLKRSSKPLIGFGGRAEPHDLDNIVIIFQGDKGSQTEEMKHIMATKIRIQDEKLKNAMIAFPSLMGRDFLKMFGYKLYVDLKNEEAYIEK